MIILVYITFSFDRVHTLLQQLHQEVDVDMAVVA